MFGMELRRLWVAQDSKSHPRAGKGRRGNAKIGEGDAKKAKRGGKVKQGEVYPTSKEGGGLA